MGEEKVYTFRVSFSDQGPVDGKQKEFYNLKVTNRGLSVSDVVSGDVILEWQYSQIRRYAKSRCQFMIEAGRMSSSGEGKFTLDTQEASIIHQRIQEKIQQIRENKTGKKETTTKHCKPLPPLPPETEDYTEPYSWVKLTPEKKVQRSDTHTDGQPSDIIDRKTPQRNKTFSNTGGARCDEKEFVVIDNGCVRLENKDKCPSPCEQRYTPMVTGSRHKGEGHSYTGLAKGNTEDSYITPVQDQLNH